MNPTANSITFIEKNCITSKKNIDLLAFRSQEYATIKNTKDKLQCQCRLTNSQFSKEKNTKLERSTESKASDDTTDEDYDINFNFCDEN